MRKTSTILFLLVVGLLFAKSPNVFAQTIFTDNFESGSPDTSWGVFYANEDELQAIPIANAPDPLPSGGNYVGYLIDEDTSYTGIALALAGNTSDADYSIEADVYCYVDHPNGSAYTGLAVYSDSTIGTYIKMTADFDTIPTPRRIRLFNNHFDFGTFSYTFDYSFYADSIPGGIPTQNGWHKMKVEVKTLNLDSTAFWCYFDDQLLGGCPVIDTSVDRMSSGKFGVYVFQNGFPLAGYYDNIVVEPLITAVENDLSTVPQQFSLYQNYPNPFNPETKISYQIIEGGFVNLSIYDLLGQKIKVLVNEEQPYGRYTINWNGTDNFGNKVPSGIYMYTLKTSNSVLTKKMVLMK